MYSLYITPPLPACIVYDSREGCGVIYREYTECYSISFLFLLFFHQSSLFPTKIFAKCFYLLVGKYGSTSYIGMTRKKMAANRKGIGLTTLKRACNSTTNTRTKYLSVVMHKTLCSIWLTFVRRENETVQTARLFLRILHHHHHIIIILNSL